MNLFIHPALVLLAGALLLPLVRGPLRSIYLLLVPMLALGAVAVNSMSSGQYAVFSYLEWELVFGRIDKLSTLFALIMAVVTVLATLYGLHVEKNAEHIAAWCYAAGSLGVIYCGDYLSLFLFWELMAFSSVFLVWFRRRPQSLRCGYRYLLIHTIGGVVLLAGILLRYQAVGDLSFNLLDVSNPQLYTWLIMLGFALNAAVVPLHSWLPDAYGEASFNGAVFLCAITTKTAVYTLARACAGFEILIVLGVIMALYGLFYALLENDIRRLLAWSIVSQVGYMVAGIGIGTELAINGAAAHAVVHILYKSLLFMGTGAVLYKTGTTKFSELGGLYRKMPATCGLTLIGCLSIAAAPGFAAYVSKSMIITAGFEAHYGWAAWLLMFAAIGTILYNGLKLPWFLFFGETRCNSATWEKAGDPPPNMLLAMTFGACLCMLTGLAPGLLYSALPYATGYNPYSAYHLVETLQLLGFSALAFYLLKGLLQPKDALYVDIDWLYRQGGRGFMWLVQRPLQWLDWGWGELYRSLALPLTMLTARFASWFDWHIIDGIVDGLARTVRALGAQLRLLQSGQMQYVFVQLFALVALLLLTLSLFLLY